MILVGALTTGIAAGCSGTSTTKGSAGSSTTSTTIVRLDGTLTPTSAIVAGQCFDPLPDTKQQPYAVLVIPCVNAHTYEAFAAEKYQTGATSAAAAYPGALVVANNSENQCFAKFAAFMGIQWEASDYDIQTWWPSVGSWTDKRDRSVLCAVYRVTGGRTKGSVAGSGR